MAIVAPSGRYSVSPSKLSNGISSNRGFASRSFTPSDAVSERLATDIVIGPARRSSPSRIRLVSSLSFVLDTGTMHLGLGRHNRIHISSGVGPPSVGSVMDSVVKRASDHKRGRY